MKAIEYLVHFTYPRHSNDHKAKALHTSTLLLLTFSLVLYQLFLQLFPITGLRILGYASQIPSSEIVNLTNQKRLEAGLSQLTNNPLLETAARVKGEHMLEQDYWAHIAPDGTEPWAFFTDVGYQYRYAGENLARDFSNPQSAFDAWIASPSHKDNLLSSKYTEIGVAVVEGDLDGVDTTIIVQLFGTQLSDSLTEATIAEAATEVVITPIPTTFVSLTPTPSSLAVAQLTSMPSPPPSENLIASTGPITAEGQSVRSLISPFDTTRLVSLVTIVSLLVVMVVDGIVVSRRKINRIGGRNFAHFAFLGMIVAIILIAKVGKIL